MRPRKDLTGQKFGRWTVISPADNRQWNCVCECGVEKPVFSVHLLRGNSKSCGCYNRERHTKHGHGRAGQTSPEYKAWTAMVRRCSDPHTQMYSEYGGRGIKVCDRWQDLAAFMSDMGPRPSPQHSIDRIDNDGDYEPSNCRWATSKEQMNNRRCSRFLTFAGRTQTLAQWATEKGVGWHVIDCRIKRGWSVERAIGTPVGRYRGSRGK
jgi:hypothetical protein